MHPIAGMITWRKQKHPPNTRASSEGQSSFRRQRLSLVAVLGGCSTRRQGYSYLPKPRRTCVTGFLLIFVWGRGYFCCSRSRKNRMRMAGASSEQKSKQNLSKAVYSTVSVITHTVSLIYLAWKLFRPGTTSYWISIEVRLILNRALRD